MLFLVLVLVFLYLGRGAVSPYLIPSCAFVFISWGRVYFCSPIPSCAPYVALALHFRDFVRPFLHSFGHGKRRRIHGLDLGGIYLDSVWGVGDLL
jgi:hypothetical protein